MFGTVILDAYSADEVESMAFAIEDLCSPIDTYGWASAGIYSFWDYDTHEVLYIGLASDLAIRFKQHNGLISMPEAGCKYNLIQDYFKKHSKLGYTIFVQSPLSQPMVHRNKKLIKNITSKLHVPIQDYANEQGIIDIKVVEGILIESHNQYYGKFPVWNKVGGSIVGQHRVRKHNINIVNCFSNPQFYNVNPIISRSSIRELSNNPSYVSYELYLHTIRKYMLINGMEFDEALNFANKFDFFNQYKKICDAGYFDKNLHV